MTMHPGSQMVAGHDTPITRKICFQKECDQSGDDVSQPVGFHTRLCFSSLHFCQHPTNNSITLADNISYLSVFVHITLN